MLTIVTRLRREQSGAALVTVVALMAISMVVVAVIGTSIFAASSVTVASRASVQSKASAEAGIDWALGEFNRSYFPCSGDFRTSDPSFSVTISYVNAAGNALTCGTTASGSPAKATIVSTGFSSITSKTAAANSHQVGAVANIVLATSGTLLDKAIFTESGLLLTNDTQVAGSAPGVLDGNVYTNGSFTCATQTRIDGTIFARGNITIDNTCQSLSSIWSGGNVDLVQSDVRIAGDVYAVGWAAINKARILGNVVANGDVTTTNKSNYNCGSGNSTNVCGSVWSLNGSINLASNGSPIAGSLYARNSVTLPNNDETPRPAAVTSLNGNLTMLGSRVTGAVSIYGSISSKNDSNIVKANTCSVTSTSNYWTKCTNELVLPMPPTSVATFSPANSANLGTRTHTVSVDKPPRQGFPQIFSSASAIASNWNGWAKPAVPTSVCSSGNTWQSQLNSILAGYSSGTKVLLQLPCTNALPGSNVSINLKGDVAIMAPYGIDWSNETRVSSTGGPWALMLVSPSDSPGVRWVEPDPTNSPGQLSPNCSGGPNLRFDKFIVSNSSRVFLYTPCEVSIRNKDQSMDGQIYAGTSSYPAGLLIKRAIMTIPGIQVPGQSSGSSSTSATITSRYDIG
ncbi:hypothetical protein HDC94_000779 [Leifsonia sp. AK011]|uniref:hypothetical protein n=1 Tax=Leifsonia sp. AK011 TaxID=2723075 RepID=UPI0015CE84F4|nr:hypothetical protein [Leifsonia sp. AK011]NYF09623.1 hypothetical protein [Leifsonia sp. AK011]